MTLDHDVPEREEERSRDRRVLARFPVRIPVRIRAGMVGWTSETLNLSGGGLLATSCFTLRAMEEVEVTLTRPGTRERLHLRAHVVRVLSRGDDPQDDDRVALAFEQPSRSLARSLERLAPIPVDELRRMCGTTFEPSSEPSATSRTATTRPRVRVEEARHGQQHG